MLFFKGQERFPTRRPLPAGLEPRAVGTHARLKQFCKMVLVVVLTVALVIGLPGAVFQGELFDPSGFAALGASCVLALLFYLWHHAARKREEHRYSRALQAGTDLRVAEATTHAAQLKKLAQHLQTVREEERGRLARDLHDEMGSLITSAKLDVARIRTRLTGTQPEAQDRLVHLTQMLDAVIALKRRIVEDLRPSSLDQLGLVATLDILARDFKEQSDVQVRCVLSAVRLAPAAQLTVFRIVQEAMTNIAKYAQAKEVWIHLGEHRGSVVLSVRDDGIGFDLAARTMGSYGLMGMRYRVDAQGGELQVQSSLGHGTLVRAVLPISGGMHTHCVDA